MNLFILSPIFDVGDGRILLYGQDPTHTLCSVCGEVISPDYVVINVDAEIGRLTHARCRMTNEYEQELLGQPELLAQEENREAEDGSSG